MCAAQLLSLSTRAPASTYYGNDTALNYMAATQCIELIVDADHFFRISEVQRFADGSGFMGRISLRSGSFALHGHRFYFDGLERFVGEVRHVYDTLSGRAELRAEYERNHLALVATPLGHVSVSGHFEFFDGESQRLEFGFSTDQTFLPPLIHSLNAV